MKLFLITALMFFSLNGFADVLDTQAGTWRGEGTWMDGNGAKGTYTDVLEINAAEDAKDFTFKSTTKIYKDGDLVQTMEGEMTLIHKGHGFYDIMNQGVLSGFAYSLGRLLKLRFTGAEAGDTSFLFNKKTKTIVQSGSWYASASEYGKFFGHLRK